MMMKTAGFYVDSNEQTILFLDAAQEKQNVLNDKPAKLNLIIFPFPNVSASRAKLSLEEKNKANQR